MSQTNSRLEFIAPFSLRNCQHRLESRHEPGVAFAWRGQTRLFVRVRELDPNTCQFVLKKVEKSAFSVPTSLARLVGQMKTQSEDRTLISVEAKLSLLWILLGSVMLGGVIGWFIFDMTLQTAQPALKNYAILVFASIGGVAAMLLFSWWYAMRDIRILTGILKESLGYLPQNDASL